MDPIEQLHRRQRLPTWCARPGEPAAAQMDLLIAATAVRYGFSLAARNGADFCHLERVLTVVDVTPPCADRGLGSLRCTKVQDFDPVSLDLVVSEE